MKAVRYTLRPASDEDYAFMRDAKFDGMRPYVEALWGWNFDEQAERFRQSFVPDQSQIIVVGDADVGWMQTVEGGDALDRRADLPRWRSARARSRVCSAPRRAVTR